MASIFNKIMSGEIPCHKLLENEQFFSFLDIRPVNPGHALVIPKKEIDYIFDLDAALLGGIFNFARPIARAIQKVVPCKKVGIMVAGLEVPHAHVHLIPIQSVGDLAFSRAKAAEPEELKQLAEKIRAHL